MGDRSSIEWTDATWNIITGCTPVSAACDHCYASRMIGRGLPHMGHEGPFSKVQFHPDRLDIPLRWKKPRRIFVCSMGDLFHEDVPWKWINDVVGTMCLAKQHTFMVLTKRPERMREFIHRWKSGDATEGDGVFGSLLFGDNDTTAYKAPLPNLWLGVTAENQEMADQRIPILLQTPAAKRFVSVEPMLGPVDLARIRFAHGVIECAGGKLPTVDWVICGGESGPGARPMHPDWPRSLRDQCQAAGVPFFFKQWGEWGPTMTPPVRDSHRWPILHDEPEGGVWSYRVGKKAAGCLLDGKAWKQFPEVKR